MYDPILPFLVIGSSATSGSRAESRTTLPSRPASIA